MWKVKRKERKRISLISMLLARMCVSVTAQNIPAKLMALHPENETVKCRFTENRVKPKVKKSETHEGSLEYKAPDYLRMDFDEPAGDYILITVDKMEQCRNGKVQSVRVKDKDHRYAVYRATLLSCLAGDVEAAADLNDATLVSEKSGNKYICTITAEDVSSKDIKEISVEYDAASGRVLMIKLTEGNGNYASYTTRP